jgi:hypothetical protein
VPVNFVSLAGLSVFGLSSTRAETKVSQQISPVAQQAAPGAQHESFAGLSPRLSQQISPVAQQAAPGAQQERFDAEA